MTPLPTTPTRTERTLVSPSEHAWGVERWFRPWGTNNEDRNDFHFTSLGNCTLPHTLFPRIYRDGRIGAPSIAEGERSRSDKECPVDFVHELHLVRGNDLNVGSIPPLQLLNPRHVNRRRRRIQRVHASLLDKMATCEDLFVLVLFESIVAVRDEVHHHVAVDHAHTDIARHHHARVSRELDISAVLLRRRLRQYRQGVEVVERGNENRGELALQKRLEEEIAESPRGCAATKRSALDDTRGEEQPEGEPREVSRKARQKARQAVRTRHRVMKGVSGRFIGYVATSEWSSRHHHRETPGRFGRKRTWNGDWEPLGMTPPHAYREETTHQHTSIGHGTLHPQDLPLTHTPQGHLSREEREPRDVAEQQRDASVELVLLVDLRRSYGEEHGGICETVSRVEEDHAGERNVRLDHILHLTRTGSETPTGVKGMS